LTTFLKRFIGSTDMMPIRRYALTATALMGALLMSGCMPEVTGTALYHATQADVEKMDLSAYGYRNGKYLNLDVGNLHLPRPPKHAPISAKKVTLFLDAVPKTCRRIGYVTIENPNGFPAVKYGGFRLGTNESHASLFFKRLQKAAALQGVFAIAYIQTGHVKVKTTDRYVITQDNGIIVVYDKKSHKPLRYSVPAYTCAASGS